MDAAEGKPDTRGTMTTTPRPVRARLRVSAAEPTPAATRIHRIRWSKVMAAQARMASGYYERDDVKEFVVDALWNELRRH